MSKVRALRDTLMERPDVGVFLDEDHIRAALVKTVNAALHEMSKCGVMVWPCCGPNGRYRGNALHLNVVLPLAGEYTGPRFHIDLREAYLDEINSDSQGNPEELWLRRAPSDLRKLAKEIEDKIAKEWD